MTSGWVLWEVLLFIAFVLSAIATAYYQTRNKKSQLNVVQCSNHSESATLSNSHNKVLRRIKGEAAVLADYRESITDNWEKSQPKNQSDEPEV